MNMEAGGSSQTPVFT